MAVGQFYCSVGLAWILLAIANVDGHGRLLDPPGRSNPYNQPEPRENEVDGIYYCGKIVKNYKQGEIINVTVELTTNHWGHFEFRLCPNNDFNKESSQECLDEHVLELADGSGTKYYIPADAPNAGIFNLNVKLPKDVTCFQCLFQWHYWTASNWGICPDGRGAQGCGPQEVFRGCADVEIN
ncbi:hypothetical protein CHUAL_007250 [Chamberlinius hualienensis]